MIDAVVPMRLIPPMITRPTKKASASPYTHQWDNGPDALEELDPIQTTLEAAGAEGQVLPVRLESRVTEVGTLALEAAERGGDRRWKLEFNVRGESDAG